MRKLTAFVAVLPLIFSFVLSYFQVSPKDKGEKLSFNSNGEFSILFVGGLLEKKGFSEEGKEFLNNMIEISKPQFVILGGNNIMTQTIITDLFLAETMKIIDAYNTIFENKGVFFSVLFGEWDNRSLFDKSAQLKRYMRSDNFVGGISNNESLQVLYNRKGALIGNFCITIYDKDAPHSLIYLIDFQENGEDIGDKKNWLKKTSDMPSFIFTNGQNYNFGNDAENFKLVSATTKGVFCSSCFDDYEFYSKNILFASLPQSGKVSGGEVTYDYKAKKIVLTNGGELFLENIEF